MTGPDACPTEIAALTACPGSPLVAVTERAGIQVTPPGTVTAARPDQRFAAAS
ncbi:hypothetical protein [Streptomyces sp. NPDC050164]|uniref:hypothetical protein n=1 Tax=Streptomyces sp. NPDC050164 TaxID=3365605 RepID=UPI0037AE599B